MQYRVLGLMITILLFCSNTLFAQDDVEGKTIDERIDEYLSPFTERVESIVFWSFTVYDDVSVPFVLLWLVFGAIFFTVYFGFI